MPAEVAHFDYDANRSRVRDANGRMLTVGLFKELARPDVASTPIFSLDDWRRTYVRVCDPTEYETAMVLIGNWEHWLAIRSNRKLAAIMDEWRQEVEIKLRSRGVRDLISLAGSKNPGASGAAKFLAEGGFVEDKRLNTKEGKAREEEIRQQVKDRTAQDVERLGLKLVK